MASDLKKSGIERQIERKLEDEVDKSFSIVITPNIQSLKISKKRIYKSNTNRRSKMTQQINGQKSTKNTNTNNKEQMNKNYKKLTDFFACNIKLGIKQQNSSEDLQDWEHKCKEKEKEIIEKEKQIQKLKLAKESVSKKFEEQNIKYENYKNKMKEILINNLRQMYQNKRREKQKTNYELGYIKDNTFMQGKLFIENKQKLSLITKKILELQQNKSQQNNEQKELLQIRIEVLEKDQKQLLEDQKKLLVEKNLYLARYKLYNQQLNCRFAKIDWPIIKQRYQSLQLLGKGGFSQVYRCYDLQDNIQVALKLSYFDSDENQSNTSYMKHIIRQHTIQKTLNHKNIVKLTQVIQLNTFTVATILQLCSGPDLSSYIKKYQYIQEKEAKFIIKQLLDALYYMDSRKEKIIHYDLKPQNIMFHQGQIKIVDFGLCKVIESNETRIQLTSQGTGTYWYLPPQTFQQSEIPKISNKVDIWSIGVIFYQMLYGKRPFGHGMSQNKILNEGIISKAYNVQFNLPNKKCKVSQQAKQFIKGCLQYSQQKRFSVTQACHHPYIKK